MRWDSVVCGLTVMAGAGIMLSCILRVGDVLGAVAMAVEPHRSWLARRIRLHRALMVFFLLGYVAMAVCCLAEVESHGEAVVAAAPRLPMR